MHTRSYLKKTWIIAITALGTYHIGSLHATGPISNFSHQDQYHRAIAAAENSTIGPQANPYAQDEATTTIIQPSPTGVYYQGGGGVGVGGGAGGRGAGAAGAAAAGAWDHHHDHHDEHHDHHGGHHEGQHGEHHGGTGHEGHGGHAGGAHHGGHHR